MSPVLITGIYIAGPQQHNLWSVGDSLPEMDFSIIEEANTGERRTMINHFTSLCQASNIDYRVHEDQEEQVVASLEKESQFADLLILGSALHFDQTNRELPENYLKELLMTTACPVLLIPEKLAFPESIILTYDGSVESLFAIKQFAYLFPELCRLETMLIYGNEDPQVDFPYRMHLQELVARHFSNLTLFKLSFDAKKYFSTWIADRTSSLLVSGSYGRSSLSLYSEKALLKTL